MTHLSESSHFALVGAGAIGLYYGGLLLKAGGSLDILARSNAEALQFRGITLRTVEPKTEALLSEIQVKPGKSVSSASEIGRVDAVLVAAKSTVNSELIPRLNPLIEPGHTVLFTLQNGMGNAEDLANAYPQNPVLAGLCFVCANRVEPTVVENYLPGKVEIGSLGDSWAVEANKMVEIFSSMGVLTAHAPVLDVSLWRKLCWNIPFNGLSIACGGWATDRILDTPEVARRSRILMKEVQAAAALAGHIIPDRFLDHQFEQTERMGTYRPSSLIDFEAGRPVEVEAIWGEPLRRGEALGAAMPELRKLKAEIESQLKK